MAFSPQISGKAETRRTPHKRRLRYEHRIWLYALFVALPGTLVGVVLIWLEPWSVESKLISSFTIILVWWIFAMVLHEQTIRPLQTLANVVGALREEDYSFRARGAAVEDALGELSLEVNALADLLAKHRTGAIEAAALLQRVVEEVDIPIFAFDPANKLRLVNSAGEKLVHRPSAQLIGKSASDLALEKCLTCENESLVELHFATDARWFVRRSAFRQQGIPHTLVVLSDVSRALREEERRAWQRLIRVLGHEVNNSLAPIKSIAGSLSARLSNCGIRAEEQQDFERGLDIIEGRAASLNRFLQGYRQLAQMPPPTFRKCSLLSISERVAGLETRVPVKVVGGPDASLLADPDQLEQMLINLLRNAAEAVLQIPDGHSNGSNGQQRGPQVVVSWIPSGEAVVITIEDEGPGLMNPSNAFVPFYTTKPGGSGIGLVLSRQIAEAHGGSLELENRSDRQGCVVRILLPTKERTA